jgi:hypothetical protein
MVQACRQISPRYAEFDIGGTVNKSTSKPKAKRTTGKPAGAEQARARARNRWWKIPLVTFLVLLFGVNVVLAVRAVVLGEPFYFASSVGRSYREEAMASFDEAVNAGVVPFSADTVMYLQIPLVLIAVLAFGFGFAFRGHARRRSAIYASVAFLVSFGCLVVQIVWLATGVPYSNFLENASPSRYAGTILALTVFSAVWGGLAVGYWRPRRTYRLTRA